MHKPTEVVSHTIHKQRPVVLHVCEHPALLPDGGTVTLSPGRMRELRGMVTHARQGPAAALLLLGTGEHQPEIFTE